MKIAIVSDLHIHHEDEQAPPDSWITCNSPAAPWTNHPFIALERLIETGIEADVVICPGDFANRASARGMAAAFSYVDKLSVLFPGAPVILTPGNHDVYTPSVADPDLLSTLRPYMERFPIASRTHSEALWRNHFTIVNHHDASFLVLNTTGKATNRASARRGVFDEPFRDALRDHLRRCSLNNVRVALLHHHPILHSVSGYSDADILE